MFGDRFAKKHYCALVEGRVDCEKWAPYAAKAEVQLIPTHPHSVAHLIKPLIKH